MKNGEKNEQRERERGLRKEGNWRLERKWEGLSSSTWLQIHTHRAVGVCVIVVPTAQINGQTAARK